MLMQYLVPELCKKKKPNEDKNSTDYQKRAKRLMTVLLWSRMKPILKA